MLGQESSGERGEGEDIGWRSPLCRMRRTICNPEAECRVVPCGAEDFTKQSFILCSATQLLTVTLVTFAVSFTTIGATDEESEKVM